MPELKVISAYSPKGDQPKAIDELTRGLKRSDRFQTLLGVTGSGKTFTMAEVIERVNRPTLVIAPNKTLAAQLANEFREFFPNNAVAYFVSYYDYYQPEAYVPQTDTYIEKDASINDEIDRLRHAATSALLSRSDVVIVASVSCIYGLGSPEDYLAQMVDLQVGEDYERDQVLRRLVDIQYKRNDYRLERGTFRVRGDVLEVYPAYGEKAVRVDFLGDQVEKIEEVNPLTGRPLTQLAKTAIYPATHFVTTSAKLESAYTSIEKELVEQLAYLKGKGKLLEAQRLEMRTQFDLEMLKEVGYCNGIENYSRHFSQRRPGEPPDTLIDYFPDNFLLIVDESHITVPQLNGMYEGDRSRKETLVKYGFRLPSALDNRPLKFSEFIKKISQVVFVSATPADYEMKVSSQVVEQIIRPTGLVDPEVIVKPTEEQVADLTTEIKRRAEKDERVLVTTLTKKMAEDLSDYLLDMGLKVRYLHADIEPLERVKILTALRRGEFTALVGINLLREGLDLPEVSLVAILDADKEGFLRSDTSLIQTIGRASRNVSGQVIMYADQVTSSMRRAINETNRRRKLQIKYNQEHGIKPETIRKAVTDILQASNVEPRLVSRAKKDVYEEIAQLPPDEITRLIQTLHEEMRLAAEELRYEEAARLRDEIKDLEEELPGSDRNP